MTFRQLFECATSGLTPYPYQQRLAEEAWPELVDVPTGMGKTSAISMAWIFKRGWRTDGDHVPPDADTPRRLIWCLPMRVLVEQTEANVRQWLDRMGILGEAGDTGRVAVHVLMGGEDDLRQASWAANPEQDAILIGTQDMLLSRALMRGYGMSRYQWPVHYALLHNDALWIFDEVQLMGPALATTTQLEAFRRQLATAKRSHSIWCSATLRPEWLGSVDFRPVLEAGLSSMTLTELDTCKPAVSRRINAPKLLQQVGACLEKSGRDQLKQYIGALADQVLEAHVVGEQTLVIVNRVERAQMLFDALGQRDASPERLLLHARFRPHERRQIESRLRQETEGLGRIVVSTQAVEAGVDIDSRVLFTELAPWSSLVQRFGRCNRAGRYSQADIFWIDLGETDQGVALPYRDTELSEARDRLKTIKSAAPTDLPAVEHGPETTQVLRRRDFLDLFNTDSDLSGFDTDISPYIRDTGTPLVQVFWRALEPQAHHELPGPGRDELCPASLAQIRDHLSKKFPAKRARHLQRDYPSAWRLDPLAGGSDEPRWVRIRHPGDIRPGQQVLLAADEGGYAPQLGFMPGLHEPVSTVGGTSGTDGDESYSSEALSHIGRWVALSEHLDNVATTARALADTFSLDASTVSLLGKAARWHDVGKGHEAFVRGIGADPADPAGPWAKSDGRGRPDYHCIDADDHKQSRRYFRHELASMLAWLEHAEPGIPSGERDLIAYLVLAHHGRVRMGLRALPDENEPPSPQQLYARGVWDGDQLPAMEIGGTTIPETTLKLDLMRLGAGPQGPSWAERSHQLLNEHGPFRLAWLESLLRIADWRASAREKQGEQQ
ncbi:MAG TPA: CRISPR-associated helicase Cas3' [Guyparkeria sp.]|nr:CRISPR-associated helicase Cas3' [Guyparkeria sp.]